MKVFTKISKTFNKKEIWKKTTYLFTIGNDKVAELLIERGADVGAVDEKSSTALILAALDGNI